MLKNKKRFAIEAIYLAAESQLNKLEADELEVPVGRELIDIMAPGFLADSDVASLRYDVGTISLLVADESDPADTLDWSIDELSSNELLAIAASIPKMIACAINEASESGDDSDEVSANNPESAVA